MPNNDWTRYNEAGAAKLTLDFLNDHFDGIQGRLDADVFHKLDQGVVISGEEALQFIYMKHANYTLMRTLQNKLKAGQNAAHRLAPVLNGEGA